MNSLILQKLYLRQFRRYDEALYEFNPRINTIIGPNAFGKTTVLEAIQFLMTGRSFRTQQTSDLIQYGQSHFYIEACFIKQGIKQSLKISYDGSERKIVHNSTVCQSSSNLLGLLQGVVVTPDNASLIKGAPLVRRHFLDLQIAQIDPLYVHHLTRYSRAMRQRNVLLKKKDLSSIQGWEHEMAGAAAYVTLQRKQAVEDLQKLGNPLHAMLTEEQHPLILDYKSSCCHFEDIQLLREHYLQQWNKMRSREKEIGLTLYGPHRDDFSIKIGDREARLFASEGQQRSCVMTLRLAEWERMRAISQEVPLMLIDDIGISLDGTRRLRLMDHLQILGQVFLTSTDEFNT
jgi:DNA replication and repair protein RecF